MLFPSTEVSLLNTKGTFTFPSPLQGREWAGWKPLDIQVSEGVGVDCTGYIHLQCQTCYAYMSNKPNTSFHHQITIGS